MLIKCKITAEVPDQEFIGKLAEVLSSVCAKSTDDVGISLGEREGCASDEEIEPPVERMVEITKQGEENPVPKKRGRKPKAQVKPSEENGEAVRSEQMIDETKDEGPDLAEESPAGESISENPMTMSFADDERISLPEEEEELQRALQEVSFYFGQLAARGQKEKREDILKSLGCTRISQLQIPQCKTAITKAKEILDALKGEG